MDFLNKPMSEVWRATKRTFNEIMEINNSDLSTGTASGNGMSGSDSISNSRPQSEPSMRYTTQNKTTSLPRLQRPRESVNIDEYHVVPGDSDDGYGLGFGAVGGPSNTNSSWDESGAEDHVSRSRLSPAEEGDNRGSFSSYQSRSRYRSNSSDRASMRNRNELMVNNRLYQRSTSYDKAMENDIEDDDEEEEDQAEKMKTKLMAMWNNMKYGWTVKSKTAFSLQKPIWFLGKCYQHRPSDPEPVMHPGMDTVKSPQMELFKQDFTSRIWMTYRREFPQLEGSTLTTDCGWGCMLRSGQMLLAQCLATHFLGRDWNIYKEQTDEQDKYHHDILRWFNDQPGDMSPFSVHRLVHVGKNSGKKAGDWYGPASVAHILRDAMETAPDLNPLFEEICIYVAQDCTVYKQDVIDMCRNRNRGSPKPTCKSRPPTPHVSKRSNNTSDDMSSQHSTVQSSPSRETLINGHHSADESHSTSRNTADVRPSKETALDGGIISHHAIPQKQPLYSPRVERTVTHNALGNSTSVNNTRYHRSHSSSANSLSSSALAREKRTKSESDAGDVCRLTDTVEHPICRRNAVKELKQGAGWTGSYMKSEPKSPDKPEHKWNWAEAKTNLQGSQEHNNPGHLKSSHIATTGAHSSRHSLRHGHHSYNANLSGHKNHSHNSPGNEQHYNDIAGQTDNAFVQRQTVPSHKVSQQRQDKPSHNASVHNFDTITHNSTGQSLQSHSGNQSRVKPHSPPSSANEHSQIQLTHNPLENGYGLILQNTSLHEPIWRRQSEELQTKTQVTGSSRNQVTRRPYSPNQVPNSIPIQLMKRSPNDVVRNSPNQGVRGNPNQAVRGNPNEVVRNIPNQVVRGNPNDVVKNNPNQAVRGNPNQAVRGNPNDVVRNSPNEDARRNPNEVVRNNPSKLARSSQNQYSKETEINGVEDNNQQGPAITPTEEIKQQCPKKEDADTANSNKNWCALILMVPMRLGGDDVNPIYVTPLKSLFTLTSCMGIIGGKPKHSLYYLGYQDEKMIHLDPHYCQAVVDMKSSRKFPTYSYHCMSPRKMRITNMDPSCTVGFYLKTEKDFEEFCEIISEVVTPAQSSGDYPMFIVRDGHCADWHESSFEAEKKDRFLRIRHIDEDGRLLAPLKDSEDFVFLES